MNGTVLGGLMPTSSAQFAQMVTDIESGNYAAAAQVAVSTPYFGAYLARRMAKEMQNVTLTETGVPDNDASTFIVAHLLNGNTNTTNTGVNGGINALFSDDVTCLVNVNGTNTHAMKLTAAQLAAVNWQTQIVCTPGQQDTAGPTTIPDADTGGFTTLSSAVADGSYAMNAFTAGTNLRGVEYLYEIGLGATLLGMAIPTGASPILAPPFVPENDPNFLVGQGQPACISCHGGGAPNLVHGYATVADIFNFDPTKGFTYIANPTPATMKSLGSNAATRTQVESCITNHTYPTGFTTCDPDSQGNSTSQAWDLSSWKTGGLLASWGWTGATSGTGLKSLGAAIGSSAQMYQFMVQRVIGEICPTGTISAATQNQYAATAQALEATPNGTGAFASIVESVASDPACR
jgi:hypothetical protein